MENPEAASPWQAPHPQKWGPQITWLCSRPRLSTWGAAQTVREAGGGGLRLSATHPTQPAAGLLGWIRSAAEKECPWWATWGSIGPL